MVPATGRWLDQAQETGARQPVLPPVAFGVSWNKILKGRKREFTQLLDKWKTFNSLKLNPQKLPSP